MKNNSETIFVFFYLSRCLILSQFTRQSLNFIDALSQLVDLFNPMIFNFFNLKMVIFDFEIVDCPKSRSDLQIGQIQPRVGVLADLSASKHPY